MVFSNCINYPRNLDYENPSSVNVIGGRNFCVEFESPADSCHIKLGAWHIVPCSMFHDVFAIRDYVKVDSRLHDELKRTQNTIVLYCHGYGDSTRIRPTEQGVVEDALVMYSWLRDSLDENNRPLVVVWGHSLGTAVAANMVAHMNTLCTELGRPALPLPDAIVLEAPFNNLLDEIEGHPFSKLVSWLPYYKDTFVKPFTSSSEYAFNTDQYLCSVPKLPILILHSKGDKIVPFSLAVKLHEQLASARGPADGPLIFHAFEKGLGLGHNNLCEAPDLKDVVENFVALVKERKCCTNVRHGEDKTCLKYLDV